VKWAAGLLELAGFETSIASGNDVLEEAFFEFGPFWMAINACLRQFIELFLSLNGYELTADDAALVDAWLALAGGDFDETAMARWLRAHITKTSTGM
jgi:hypothetical protein